jgi:rod shape-determining protein MreC
MNAVGPVLVERKPFLLLLLLLALHLGLMSSRLRGASGGSLLEDAILTVASPFLKGASWMGRGTAGSWRSYVDLRGVEEENRRLHREVDDLAPRAREAEEVRLEVERLRRLLDLRSEVESPTLAARVIAKLEGGGARTLLLDRGSHDGLRTNQPVITPRGVVGRVIEAAPGVAKVQTILDPNSGVAALVQRTRVQGIVVGEGRGGCRMEYLSELSQVEVCDVVVTSGLDQIYPKGYIIGTVSEIAEGEGLTKNVAIRTEVEFRRLEEVLVFLRPVAPAETR